MLQKDYQLGIGDSFEDVARSSRQDDSKFDDVPVVHKIAAYSEQRVIELFNLCCYDMKQWHTAFIIQWVILTLQLIRFLSDAYIPYNWKSDVARIVMAIADFVTEIPFASVFIAYVISVCVCVSVIAFSIFTALAHRYKQWIIPIKCLRMILLWFPVIYFPLIIPHLKMVLPCLSYSSQSYTIHPFYEEKGLICWSTAYDVYFGVSIIIATAIFTMEYLITACFYNSAMPGGHPMTVRPYNAKYTSYNDVMMLLAKTVLLILYIGGHTSTWRYAMGILTILSGLAAAVHLLWTMSWWHDVALLLYIYQALILAWTGVTAVLMTALDDTEGTGMFYFVMLPVLLIAAQMAMQWRIRIIGELNASEFTDGTLVLTKIRYLARSYFRWLGQFGDIYIDESDEQMRELMSIFALVEDVLGVGMMRFPEHVDLHLYTTQFFLGVHVNRVRAYRSLRFADNASNTTLDQRFRAQLLRHVLEMATTQEQSQEVRHYTEFKERRAIADEAVLQAMRALIEFWTEIMQTHPNIDKLSVTGERARQHLNASIAHWERLLEINPDNVQMLRLYGMFCLEIIGDVQRAQDLFSKAETLIRNKQRLMIDSNYGDFLRKVNIDLDIFDEENGVVGVSIDPESIGIVNNVNPAFLRMFGFSSRGDIVGKSINTIIPSPMKVVHDRYMMDYLRTLQSNVVNNTRVVLARHAFGHLVPLAQKVMYENEAMGRLIAVMYPVASSFETCMIVDPKTLEITCATLNFASVFGFNRRDVLAGRIKLFNLIPELKDDESAHKLNEDIHNQLASSRGYECHAQHALTKQRFHLHSYLTHIQLYEDSFFYVRCQIAQMQNGEGDAYESENELEALPIADKSPSFASSPSRSPVSRTPPAVRGSFSRASSPQTSPVIKTATPTPHSPSNRYRAPTSPANLRYGQPSSPSGFSRRQALANDQLEVPNQRNSFSSFSLSNHPSTGYPQPVPKSLRSASDTPAYIMPQSPNAEQPVLFSNPKADQSKSLFAAQLNIPSPESTSPVFFPALSPSALSQQSPKVHSASLSALQLSRAATATADATTSATASASSSSPTIVPVPSLSPSQHTPPEDKADDAPPLALLSLATPAAQPDIDVTLATHEHPLESSRAEYNSFASHEPSPLDLQHTLAMHHSARDTQIKAQSESPRHAAVDDHSSVDVELKSRGESHMAQHGYKHAQRRLTKAIENDNKHTVRQLSWYSYFAFGICFVSVFLVMTDFFFTEADMSHISNLLSNIYLSTIRQSQAVAIGSNLFVYFLFVRYPDAVALPKMFYRPSIHANDSVEVVSGTTAARVAANVQVFAETSALVDSMATDSAARRRLREQDVFSVLMLSPTTAAKHRHIQMSLRTITTYITALASWSVYESRPNVADDPGYFFIISNTASRAISDAFELDTKYIEEEISQRYQYMVDVTVIMTIVTVVAALLIAAALLLPMLLRVERAKANVLDIFLSVPPSVRTALRRKALRVYRLVEKADAGEKHVRSLLVDNIDDDNDNEGGADGNMSTAGTETTSLTQATDLGSADDDFTRLFQRYKKRRALADAMSTNKSGNNTATERSVHGGSRRHSGHALHPLGNAHVDENESVVQIPGKRREIDDEFRMSSETNIEEKSQAQSSVWTGRAIRVASVRYSVFILLLGLYFMFLLLQSEIHVTAMRNAVHRVSLGNSRAPLMLNALFYMVLHLCYNKEAMAVANPLEPAIHSPLDWREEGLAVINAAQEAFFATTFGDPKLGVDGRVHDRRQDHVLFGNICEIDPEEMFELYPDGRAVPHLFAQCATAQNGINTRGLWASFNFLREQYEILFAPENNRAFAYVIEGGYPKLSISKTLALKATVDVAYQYYNDFMHHHLVYSGAIYRQMALEEMARFTDTRILLVVLCASLIFISYFALIRPTTLILARSCHQANAIMLILPPQLARILPAAQRFTEENLSKD